MCRRMHQWSNRHTTAGRSGINPGNPLSISPLVPRKTKLMVARGLKSFVCVEKLYCFKFTPVVKYENPLPPNFNNCKSSKSTY